ncbi:MAG: cytidylate kinase-like family protein [Candidatus Krumholzibacteriia bacterium]
MSRQVIETLISRQLHQYNRLRSFLKHDPDLPPAARGPVVTISRMAGCCARGLAAALAERLEVQVWGRELVDLIATDRGLRQELVTRLDQGHDSPADAWVKGVLSGRMFLRTDYVMAVAQTLRALADSGGAVVVGRGASFILGERADLRLRLVAGEPYRMRTIEREYDVEGPEARRLLERLDREREEFIRSHFRRDVHDVRHYDLVVNVERVATELLVDACVNLVRARQLQADAAEG